MTHHNPQGFPPFGDDEDANRRLFGSLGLIGQLAQASAKLAGMKTTNLNAVTDQKGYVADLRGEILGRAEAAGKDVDEFIEAGCKELGKRLRRKVTIAPVAAARPAVDEDEARLQATVYEAEIAEEKAVQIDKAAQARAAGTKQRADAATGVAARARAALATYRTTRKAAA